MFHDIIVPQETLLSGEDIFTLHLEGVKVDQFMISTPEGIHDTGYWFGWYRNKKEIPDPKPPFRCEVLFGANINHESAHLDCGTQAFGSYLRGHVNSRQRVKVDDEWVRSLPDDDFLTIQQYYRSDWHPKTDYLPVQVRMNKYGITKMFDAGIVEYGTLIYLEDHSWLWDKYVCDPLCLLETGVLMKFFDRPDAETTFREYSRYGKDYHDMDKALQCFL